VTRVDLPRTIAESAAALRRGTLTSVDLVRAAHQHADEIDGSLGAFTIQYREQSLEAAALADDAFAAGLDKGALQGIPLGVKDIIAARESATSASSAVVDSTWWANTDAPVVGRLRSAGGVILGKTTTMEYALGEPDGDQGLPEPRSAWDLTRWAGGSSSGSGSGVAAGLMLGAIGTDTGGSVRLPAAFNGISGHKPTFGLVPKSGIHVLGFSMDAVGPLARTVEDCAILLEAMVGHDASDPTSVHREHPGFVAALDVPEPLAGLRIGVDIGAIVAREGIDPALLRVFETALEVFANAGAEIVPIVTPPWEMAAKVAAVSWQVDALSYHRELLRTHWSKFGRGIRAQFIEGMLLTPSDSLVADRVRRMLVDATAALLSDVDVIVSPTVGRGALPYHQRSGKSVDETAFTSIWNLTGGPASSLPMGFTSDGLPLGLQIAGRPFDDARILGIGHAFQGLTEHHLALPKIAATRSIGSLQADALMEKELSDV
jgi:aspartyl-tRNA(Asn)/glutamyl-tRNA(Gln) amidotransferase subunit A